MIDYALFQAIEQCKWLEKAREFLKSENASPLDSLKQLIDSGAELVTHKCCEPVLFELRQLYKSCDILEQKAFHCLNSKYVPITFCYKVYIF